VLVLDTAALLFWIANTGDLSSTALTAIDESDQILVSSISIWEIGWKVKQAKLELPTSVREFAHRLVQVHKVTVVPVDTEIWLRNVELSWEHRDPADRTIVATADLRGCPLVTSDRRMQAFYPRAIW
jgi:PIN domain nuclease of toxin-antitoxin system